MKCFIHRSEEAVATCKQCGKAMCIDCSAYSEHTGICPECRRKEFIEKRNQLLYQIENLRKERIKAIVFAVLLCILIIPILMGIYKAVTRTNRINELEQQACMLDTEIQKLNKALSIGRGI